MTNPHNPRLVALDFDGVICDSMDECMVVAYTAYTGHSDPPASFVEFFRKHRHIVRPAREYYLIVDAYHRGIDPVAAGFMPAMMEFESRYFAVRENLRKADLQAWVNLHHAYPQFLTGWPQLRDSTIPHVVTTRDKGSLKDLLHAFGIDIPPQRWWTKERTNTKPEAIRAIAAEHHVPASEILFVDDHPGHLQDVSAAGATVFWANWGYWPSQNGFKAIGSIKELIDE